MALTVTETIGFCEEVGQFMSANSAALTAKGLTVTTWITELTTQRTDLVTKNDLQEAAKADLRTKTSAANAAQVTAYDSASSKLDAIIRWRFAVATVPTG